MAPHEPVLPLELDLASTKGELEQIDDSGCGRSVPGLDGHGGKECLRAVGSALRGDHQRGGRLALELAKHFQNWAGAVQVGYFADVVGSLDEPSERFIGRCRKGDRVGVEAGDRRGSALGSSAAERWRARWWTGDWLSFWRHLAGLVERSVGLDDLCGVAGRAIASSVRVVHSYSVSVCPPNVVPGRVGFDAEDFGGLDRVHQRVPNRVVTELVP